MSSPLLTFTMWPMLLIIMIVAGQDEDYVYDEDASSEANEDEVGQGDRLVGASRGKVDDIPFIVGYSTEPLLSVPTTCTGSLIARRWVLSAAHCIIYLVNDKNYDDCAKKTNKYKSGRVSCDWLANGSLKINLNPPGIAYLGVADANRRADIDRGHKSEIDYVVKHNQSYLAGGTYGDFGGYDIALIHLASPAPDSFTSACLPGPHFKDSAIGPAFPGTEQANLAGFGKYTRAPCMTDAYGPAKYHYCTRNKGNYMSVDSCNHSKAPITELCQKFLNKKWHIFSLYSELQDAIVIDSTGKKHYCYRRKAIYKSLGWCHVERDASVIGEEREVQSWGFCSKDCYIPDDAEPAASVLRTVRNVDILPQRLCDHYLDVALRQQVQVRPEILCIGHMKAMHYRAYKQVGGKFRRIKIKGVVHKLQASSGLNITVHSAGTCNGDSGGPVFVKHDSTGEYVVLGVVSGGRGVLSNCGGLNNPTHYARVKKFGKWIGQVLGPKDSTQLCFKQK